MVDEPEMVEFLKVAYQANRDKLRQFTCRFHVLLGTAASVEAAVAGDIKVRTRLNCLWCVDGDLVRYEKICADPAQDRVPDFHPGDSEGDGTVLGMCDSERVLGNGQMGMCFSRGMGAASLSPSRGAEPLIYYTPISLGLMGDAEKFAPITPKRRSSGSGRAVQLYGGTWNRDGSPLEVFLNGYGTDDNPLRVSDRWMLDPSRGYAPVYFEYITRDSPDEPEVVSNIAVYTDVRREANGAYFPYRGVECSVRSQSPAGVPVTVIEVDSFVLGPPDRSMFAIHLPAETMIMDNVKPGGAYSMQFSRTIAVDELAAYYAYIADKTAVIPRPTPADIPPPPFPEPRDRRWWLIATNSILVAACFAFYWYKRRGPKPTATNSECV